jgi:signal transduction histidine kinase
MKTNVIRVLLVAGEAQTARRLRQDLGAGTRTRMELTHYPLLEKAIEAMPLETFDATLLDLELLGSAGLEALRRLHGVARAMPIIVLADFDNETLALEAVREGAQDYVVKSRADARMIARVIRYAIERKRAEEALHVALEELRVSHEQLKAARLQLIQAEKLECIGTLAAGVAHEVKNPLQTIMMGLHYLTGNVCGDENVSMVLNEMRDSIKRADLIVRELVTFAATNHPDKRDESMNRIIDRALGLVKYELARGQVSVVRELNPEVPPVPLDANKIEQALINLFLNAVQAMPEGGTLTVRTSWRGAPIEAGSVSQVEGEVTVEVLDTGEGIPLDQVRRIFDPFVTLKPSGKGTGLGLSVTRRIVELHGGKIEAMNRDSGGARFVATFPLQPERKKESPVRGGEADDLESPTFPPRVAGCERMRRTLVTSGGIEVEQEAENQVERSL